ncbi:MAG: DHH family phosphoesterase, partial [Elusimicrobiota bacterium]|nr:DHH family phosphoesterase [Elusimicrobiota bacterium]
MNPPPWTSRLKKAAEILIIHHWDSDGISSAAIFTRFLKNMGERSLNITYAVPSAGTYRLLPGVNLNIPPRSYSLIAVLDYSAPKEDILYLKEQFQVPIVIYDHHLREPVDEEDIFYYNPVARGESGKSWPSTTWVLKKYLKLPVSSLVVMGIAGDLEERFLPGGFRNFPEVKEYLDSDKEQYFRYVRAKSLIDIHYKENDEKILTRLASTLLELDG